MAAIDLATAQVLVGIVLGVLTIMGILFGWFGTAWRWARGRLRSTGALPRRTLIVLPSSRGNALWWHMGSTGTEDAMQIVGDLTATNVAEGDVLVTSVKLRRPKSVGTAMVCHPSSGSYSPRHPIARGQVSDVRVDFFLKPPVRARGEPFTGDIALVDQFGNEHWLNNLEFKYT